MEFWLASAFSIVLIGLTVWGDPPLFLFSYCCVLNQGRRKGRPPPFRGAGCVGEPEAPLRDPPAREGGHAASHLETST